MTVLGSILGWRRSSAFPSMLPRSVAEGRPTWPVTHRAIPTKKGPVMHARQPLSQQPRGFKTPAVGEGATVTALYGQESTRQLTQQELLDFGATFVKHWFTGIARGPAAVHPALTDMLHQDVTLMGDSVRIKHDHQGLPEVLAELERSHLEYPHSQHQPMLYAASPSNQRVYALVEGRYQDLGALPGHPATFRISRIHVIMALEVHAGRVVRLWLRRQLTEEDKDELLCDPVHCYPTPFPKDSVQLASAGERERSGSKMVAAVKAWWSFWSETPVNNGTSPSTPSRATSPAAAAGGPAAAVAGGPAVDASAPVPSSTRPPRSSRPSPDILAAVSNLMSPDFKMWDAYGLYSHMRVKGRRHLTREGAVRFLQKLAYQHRMEVQVLDVAVAEGSLCCFTHWRVVLKPKWGKAAVADEMNPEVVGVAAAGKAVAEAVKRSRAAAAGIEAAVAGVEAAATEATADDGATSSGSRGSISGPDASASGMGQDEGISDTERSAVPSVTGTPHPTPEVTGSSSSSQEADAVAGPAEAIADQASTAAAAKTAGGAVVAAADDGEQGYVVEGMEVDVFDDELQLHDIWLFRGPLETEQRLFLAGRTPMAAAAAAGRAQAVEEHERMLEVRRQQREEQLQELLAWMQTYQRDWAERISHVQKALQRHKTMIERSAEAAAAAAADTWQAGNEEAAAQAAGATVPSAAETAASKGGGSAAVPKGSFAAEVGEGESRG